MLLLLQKTIQPTNMKNNLGFATNKYMNIWGHDVIRHYTSSLLAYNNYELLVCFDEYDVRFTCTIIQLDSATLKFSLQINDKVTKPITTSHITTINLDDTDGIYIVVKGTEKYNLPFLVNKWMFMASMHSDGEIIISKIGKERLQYVITDLFSTYIIAKYGI